jgi:hypothetical protein
MRRESGFDWFPPPRAPTPPIFNHRRSSTSSGVPTPTELQLMAGDAANLNDRLSRYLPPRRSVTHGNLYGDYISAKPIIHPQNTHNTSSNDGLSPTLQESSVGTGATPNSSGNDGLTTRALREQVSNVITPIVLESRTRKLTIPVIVEDD